MNQDISDAYRSSAVANRVQTIESNARHSWAAVGLGLSVFSLAAAIVITGLASVGILPISWDSSLAPSLAFFICIPAAFFGGLVSLVSLIIRPGWMPVFGIFLGIIATLVGLGLAYLLAMAGLATHPV